MSILTETEHVAAATFAREVINKFPDVESKPLDGNSIELITPRDHIRDIVKMIDERFDDAFPELVFGVDLEEGNFEVVYIFWMRTSSLLLQIRITIQEDDLWVDTVSDIYPGFEWHERETHEMFGIDFKGHPDLRLLLLPEELEGQYPLRKSFETDRSRLEESGMAVPKPRPAPKASAESKSESEGDDK
jgi:NADH-quinone oxidoreductase subunit C